MLQKLAFTGRQAWQAKTANFFQQFVDFLSFAGVGFGPFAGAVYGQTVAESLPPRLREREASAKGRAGQMDRVSGAAGIGAAG